MRTKNFEDQLIETIKSWARQDSEIQEKIKGIERQMSEVGELLAVRTATLEELFAVRAAIEVREVQSQILLYLGASGDSPRTRIIDAVEKSGFSRADVLGALNDLARVGRVVVQNKSGKSAGDVLVSLARGL